MAKQYAIVIGITDYHRDRAIPAVPGAANDATKFAALLKASFGAIDVRIDQAAEKKQILALLNAARTRVGAGDRVYVFLSARATTHKDFNDAYLLCYDSEREKPVPSSIAVRRDILDALLSLRVKELYLFADVHRAQELKLDLAGPNTVTSWFGGLQKDRPSMAGVLAGKNDPRFLESGKLGPGTGLFTTVLLNEWAAKGNHVELKNRIAAGIDKKNANQKPESLGLGLKDATFWLPPAPAPAPAIPNGYAPRPLPGLGLLASLRFFQNGVGDRLRLHREFDIAFARRDLSRALGLLQALQQTPGPDSISDKNDLLAVTLEEEGQRLITQYGIGDQFPRDSQWERDFVPTSQDYKAAAEKFQKAHDLRPNNRTLLDRKYFAEGRADLRDGNRVDAFNNFLKAHNQGRERTFAEVYDAIGIMQMEDQKFSGAESYLLQAIKAEPHWAFPRYNLALLYTANGMYREAETQYRNAIAITPYYPHLHQNLAVLLQRLRRERDAEKEYKKAKLLFETLEARYRERAATERSKDRAAKERAGEEPAVDHSAAADLAEKTATALRRNSVEALNGLAAAREGRGRPEDALEFYRQAVGANPQIETSRYNLASLLAKMAVRSKNLAQRKEAIDLHRGNLQFRPSRIALAKLLAEDAATRKDALAVIAVAPAEDRDATVIHARLLIALNQPGLVAEKLYGHSGADVSELLGDAARLSGDTSSACKHYASAWAAGLRSKDLSAKRKGCAGKK